MLLLLSLARAFKCKVLLPQVLLPCQGQTAELPLLPPAMALAGRAPPHPLHAFARQAAARAAAQQLRSILEHVGEAGQMP